MAESDQIAEDVERFDAQFRADHPLLWWATLTGPFLLTFAILAVMAADRGWEFVRLVLATATATFFFFGRFVILGGESADRPFLSAEALVLLVFYMDIVAASLIGFHAGVLWKLPFVGGKLHRLVGQGKALIAANPRVKRATFLTITAFVMFPLAATGSIGGSLFARLLGMSRFATFLAVLTGSLLGCGLMYFGATLINRYFDRSNPVVTIGGLAFVVAVILVLSRRFRAMTIQPRD